MKLTFKQWTGNIKKFSYQNGRTALELQHPDGDRIATITVNLPDWPLGKNEILVKDYSENAGMLAALVAAGFVKHTGKYAQSGYVQIPICEPLVSF